MNIKLARIHNRKMLAKFAQAANTAAPAATTNAPANTSGANTTASTPAASTPAPSAPTQPTQPPAANAAYDTFVQRHQFQALANQSWLNKLFNAYQPAPSTKLENDLAAAVRRATGTSSDRIQEHLANATTRLPAAKDNNLRDQAVNEYGKWNEQTRSERQRIQGQAESQKSQDVNQAYEALLEWKEGTDDPTWLFLTDQVSSSALKQAQAKIVRDIERAGMEIIMRSPTSFATYISDEGSFFNTIIEQGYAYVIQSKGGSLPIDAVMSWAEALNEATRMIPQYQRFVSTMERAVERDETSRGARGIRNKATLQGLQDRLNRQNTRRR